MNKKLLLAVVALLIAIIGVISCDGKNVTMPTNANYSLGEGHNKVLENLLCNYPNYRAGNNGLPIEYYDDILSQEKNFLLEKGYSLSELNNSENFINNVLNNTDCFVTDSCGVIVVKDPASEYKAIFSYLKLAGYDTKNELSDIESILDRIQAGADSTEINNLIENLPKEYWENNDMKASLAFLETYYASKDFWENRPVNKTGTIIADAIGSIIGSFGGAITSIIMGALCSYAYEISPSTALEFK